MRSEPRTMHFAAFKRGSEVALLGLAVLFLITLSLDWHRTSVRVFAEGDAEVASSGWNGWGILAGFCALAIVGLELDRQLRKRSHEGQALVDLGLAVGAAIATLAAVFTGDTSVSGGGEEASTLWPAWVALVLAGLMVVAAVVPTLPEAEAETERATPAL